MTAGQLPLGFQSPDFPNRLKQLYFCETNLQTLPDDLDFKWNLNSNIYIENSQLEEVPLALVRLQPFYLSLTGNPIAELPPELFETNSIEYLILSQTRIQELPRRVKQILNGPKLFDVANTNLASFWSWIDPFVESALEGSARLAAGGSMYCEDLDKILTGISTGFSTPFETDFSQLLMNASEANSDFLRQAIDCSSHSTATQFPLEA